MASVDRIILRATLLSFFVLYNLTGCLAGTTAKPEPETSAEPETTAEPEGEGKPEPEGEAEITPEQFWQWLRDEPQWFALIGMGVVVVLLLVIIIVLICRLKPSKG